MQQSHSTQAQLMVSHCRLTSPTGERLFTDKHKVSSDWLPSYIKAMHQLSRYSKWMDTFRTALVTALLSFSGNKKHDILKKTASDCKLKTKSWF